MATTPWRARLEGRATREMPALVIAARRLREVPIMFKVPFVLSAGLRPGLRLRPFHLALTGFVLFGVGACSRNPICSQYVVPGGSQSDPAEDKRASDGNFGAGAPASSAAATRAVVEADIVQ